MVEDPNSRSTAHLVDAVGFATLFVASLKNRRLPRPPAAPLVLGAGWEGCWCFGCIPFCKPLLLARQPVGVASGRLLSGFLAL